MFTTAINPTLLLVHGAWHGSWCWEELQPELTAKGWKSRTVDLPSAVKADSSSVLPGVFDDARAIREAIDDIDGRVVVVAHSYGGIPATQAIADVPKVSHVVCLAGFLLDVGDSMTSFYSKVGGLAAGAPQPDPASVKGLAHPVDDPADSFFSDVPDVQKASALARLVHQSGRSFADQITRAGWRTISSSYIVCDNDHMLPPVLQNEMSFRATAVYHLPSGHSPFFSMPGELASLLVKIADESGATKQR